MSAEEDIEPVDFQFSDEQLALRDATAEAVTAGFGVDAAAAVARGDLTSLAPGWKVLVQMGLPALLVPTRLGGEGSGVVEACLVAESLAAGLAAVPYVSSSIAAAAVLRAFPGAHGDALLSELAAGSVLCLGLDADLRLPTRSPAAFGWEWVPGARVLTSVDGAPVAAAVDDASAECSGVDPLHRLVGLTPTEDRGWLPAHAPALPPELQHAQAIARIGVAAALYGTARGAADLAFDYVRHREQYGQVIGSFQAVQHLCADLYVDLESSRSVVYGSAWAVEHADPAGAPAAAATAAWWCGVAAVRCAERAIQLLGGIGITWESPAHLYLRQAQTYAGVLGGGRLLARELGRDLMTAGETTSWT